MSKVAPFIATYVVVLPTPSCACARCVPWCSL